MEKSKDGRCALRTRRYFSLLKIAAGGNLCTLDIAQEVVEEPTEKVAKSEEKRLIVVQPTGQNHT